MKTRGATKSLDLALEMWDLYSRGDYIQVTEMGKEETEGDAKDISALARLELLGVGSMDVCHTTFKQLFEGMRAWHTRDHKLAASTLGAWLMQKSYFSTLMLDRFIDSCKRSENWSILHADCRKYLDWKNHFERVIEPLFLSTFHLGRHKEALELFEKYRKHLNDAGILQKVSFSLMELRRYQDAERLLVALYEKITGTEYEDQYDRVKEKYTGAIQKLPELRKKLNSLNVDEQMEVGMACLFSGDYEGAIAIFRGLTKHYQS